MDRELKCFKTEIDLEDFAASLGLGPARASAMRRVLGRTVGLAAGLA
jgi:hypothetical protein